MTYSTGSPVLATDYNTFANLANGVNQLFSDTNVGATSLPAAGFGYGQHVVLPTVASGESITAAQWATLFNLMKRSGTHQGTTTVPPLPSITPVPGDLIVAYASVSTLLDTLNVNRFNISPSQLTYVAGPDTVSTGTWTHAQTYAFGMDFGSWDNARYFFNSGGKLILSGFYTPAGFPSDANWGSLLDAMRPLTLGYNATTWGTGTNLGTGAGFYGLTASPQVIYRQAGGVTGRYYYTTNKSIAVSASLGGAPGSSGMVNFSITLADADAVPLLKRGITTYRIDKVVATGANVAYPGTVIFNGPGFTNS